MLFFVYCLHFFEILLICHDNTSFLVLGFIISLCISSLSLFFKSVSCSYSYLLIYYIFSVDDYLTYVVNITVNIVGPAFLVFSDRLFIFDLFGLVVTVTRDVWVT